MSTVSDAVDRVLFNYDVNRIHDLPHHAIEEVVEAAILAAQHNDIISEVEQRDLDSLFDSIPTWELEARINLNNARRMWKLEPALSYLPPMSIERNERAGFYIRGRVEYNEYTHHPVDVIPLAPAVRYEAPVIQHSTTGRLGTSNGSYGNSAPVTQGSKTGSLGTSGGPGPGPGAPVGQKTHTGGLGGSR